MRLICLILRFTQFFIKWEDIRMTMKRLLAALFALAMVLSMTTMLGACK